MISINSKRTSAGVVSNAKEQAEKFDQRRVRKLEKLYDQVSLRSYQFRGL